MSETNASKHKSQIRISQKPLGLSKKALPKSFLEFYLLNNSFCSKRLLSNLQKSRIAVFKHFWLECAVFSICDPLKNCFQAKFTLKKSPEHPEANWYVLNKKLIWNSKKIEISNKLAIFDFTCYNIGSWNLQIFKLPFYRKFLHKFAIERYQWLQEIQ